MAIIGKPEEPRCVRCHFCAISGMSGEGDSLWFQARCRRYAPNPEQAYTTVDNWCGEFQETTLETVISHASIGLGWESRRALKREFNKEQA